MVGIQLNCFSLSFDQFARKNNSRNLMMTKQYCRIGAWQYCIYLDWIESSISKETFLSINSSHVDINFENATFFLD